MVERYCCGIRWFVPGCILGKAATPICSALSFHRACTVMGSRDSGLLSEFSNGSCSLLNGLNLRGG